MKLFVFSNNILVCLLSTTYIFLPQINDLRYYWPTNATLSLWT